MYNTTIRAVGENTTKMEIEENIWTTRDENLAHWEIAVLSGIFLFTVFGNYLVLFALYLRRYHGRRRKLTRMYFFVMHLSIADLLNALLYVLPQLVWKITFRFQGGPVLCKIVKFIHPLPTYLSSYILTATAIDRYHAICHPINYCRTTSRRSKSMVYGAWCVALLLCTPQILVFSYQMLYPGVWDCWASFPGQYDARVYVTWFSVTVLFLPFTVLVFTYTRICYAIWKNGEISGFAGRDGTRTERNREPLISRARISTVRQMIIVVSLYVITNSPFIGSQLWAVWDSNANSSPFFDGPTFAILALLSSLTSCVNPWIYLGFNTELRIILRNFFKKTVGIRTLPGVDRDLSWNTSNSPSKRSSLISRFSRSNSSTRQQLQQHRNEKPEEMMNIVKIYK